MCETCGCSADLASLQVRSQETHPPTHDSGGGEHERAHSHPHVHYEHGHAHEHAPDRDNEPPARLRTVRLEQDILAKNNLLAARNRGWLEGRGIVTLNLMSSPGSGKTKLVERTISDLKAEFSIAVIEGDQATARDAQRIRDVGAAAVQINTGAGCHLDAEMVAHGLQTLNPPPGALVIIENVGNLVCPALFDLGEAAKVVMMSVAEGEDKPLKYPHMFAAAHLMIINKLDLLPYVEFDLDRCISYARQVNPGLVALNLSAIRGDGLARWYEWLRARNRAWRL